MGIRQILRSDSEVYCPVSRKTGDCGGDCGTACAGVAVVPASGVSPTSGADTLHSNCVCVPDGGVNPVASTVRICPFKGTPAADVKLEILTRVPGMKLFTAVKVTTLEVIQSPGIGATDVHPVMQFPNGASRSVISVSGVFVPVAIVVVVVETSATAPAS